VSVAGDFGEVRWIEIGAPREVYLWQCNTVRRLQRQLTVTRQVLYRCHVDDPVIRFIAARCIPDRPVRQQRTLCSELDVWSVHHPSCSSNFYSIFLRFRLPRP